MTTKITQTAIRRSPGKAAAVAQYSIDDLGQLPRTYGLDSIFLVAQEPHWLFTYWDIDISRHPGGPCFLRVEHNGVVEQEIEVPFETRNWYIPAKNAGAKYFVEIGFYRSKSWNLIARSGDVVTPRDRVSEVAGFDYATIPLHVSFQRLVETVEQSFQTYGSLVPALSGAQKLISGRLFEAPVSEIPAPERQILGLLLGSEFLANLSSMQWGSQELHSAVHQRLQERLNSGELAEIVSRLQLGVAESSLFSAFAARWGAEITSGSWNTSSGGFSERFTLGLSSWITGALTSWTSAAQSSWSTGALASWSAGAKGSEAFASWPAEVKDKWAALVLSSWPQGLSGNWPSGPLSSWPTGIQSSWFEAVQTSWFSALQSSWSGGVETSALGAAASTNLNSWLETVLFSWGGVNLSSWAESVVSSWNNAESSWGSSEAGPAFSEEQELDLQAEITFRGRTHPQGQVTIDGNAVSLQTDGSFEYQIPIDRARSGVFIEATTLNGASTKRTTFAI